MLTTAPRLPQVQNPAKRFSFIYVIALLVIFGLASVSQYLVRSSLDKQVSDGALIKVSGKQVILSQQMAKQILLLAATEDATKRALLLEELSGVYMRWENTHLRLTAELAHNKLSGSLDSPIVARMYQAIEQSQIRLKQAVQGLLAHAATDAGFAAKVAEAKHIFLDNEDRYATGMDRIVYQYALEAKEKVKDTERTQWLLFIAIVAALLFIGVFVFRPAVARIRMDVRRLNEAYQQLAFQTDSLQAANSEIATQKARLETSNRELQAAYEHLNATQNQLVHSEKMAALGQLVAGVAHEINTPLGAINASCGTLQKGMTELSAQLPDLGKHLTPELLAIFEKIAERSQHAGASPLSSREERQQRKLLQTELADRGFAKAATWAREFTRMGIRPEELDSLEAVFASPVADKLIETATLSGKMYMHLNYIHLSASKMQKIVFALKSYSHRQFTDEPIRMDINQNIHAVLTLYQSTFKQGVQLDTLWEENLPSTYGYPDELNQVWTNLIHNALQAMGGKGYLRVCTLMDADLQNILVRITDHGPGIPQDVQARMWEPFFTTKAAGEGSGLGLDIVRRIVNKHRGSIHVESESGLTSFTVSIPLIEAPLDSTSNPLVEAASQPLEAVPQGHI